MKSLCLCLLLVCCLCAIAQRKEIVLQPSETVNARFSRDGEKIICDSNFGQTIIDRRSGVTDYISSQINGSVFYDYSDYSYHGDTIIYMTFDRVVLESTVSGRVIKSLQLDDFSEGVLLLPGHRFLTTTTPYGDGLPSDLKPRKPEEPSFSIYTTAGRLISQTKMSAEIYPVALALSQNGKYIGVHANDTSNTHHIVYEYPSMKKRWHFKSRSALAQLRQNVKPVFSPASDKVLFRLSDNSINLIDLSTGKTATLRSDKSILAYGFSSSNEALAVDGTSPGFAIDVRLNNLTTGLVRAFHSSKTLVKSASISEDGGKVLLDLGNFFQIFTLPELTELPGVQSTNVPFVTRARSEFIGRNLILRHNQGSVSFIKQVERFPDTYPLGLNSYEYIKVGNSRRKLCAIKKDTLAVVDLQTGSIKKIESKGLLAQRRLMQDETNFYFDDQKNRLYHFDKFMGVTVKLYSTETENVSSEITNSSFESVTTSAFVEINHIAPQYNTDYCFVWVDNKALVKYDVVSMHSEVVGKDMLVTDLCESPDGKYLAIVGADKIRIYDAAGWKLINEYDNNGTFFTKAKISADNQYLIGQKFSQLEARDAVMHMYSINDSKLTRVKTSGRIEDFDTFSANSLWISRNNDQIELIDMMSEKTIVNLDVNSNANFIAYTPDGYYCADNASLSRINYKTDGGFLKPNQVDIYYNRPDIVMKRIPGTSRQSYDLFRRLCLKRFEYNKIDTIAASKVADVPEITIIDKNKIAEVTKDEKIQFSIRAKDRVGLKAIYVCVNGNIVATAKNLNSKQHAQQFTVSITPGFNSVYAVAQNEDGWYSNEAGVKVIRNTMELPNLYLIAAGIRDYTNGLPMVEPATNDVDTLLRVFQQKKNNYRNVFTLELKDKWFQMSSIETIRNFIANADIGDRIVFFYEGHGIWDNQKSTYFLSVAATDPKDPAATAVPLDRIRQVFDESACRNIVILLNSCNAGEIDPDQLMFETMRTLFTDLRVNNKIHIITTSFGTTKATFYPNQNNTHMVKLLSSLRNYPQLSVGDLFQNLNMYMMNQSFGRQRANYMLYNRYNYFQLW